MALPVQQRGGRNDRQKLEGSRNEEENGHCSAKNQTRQRAEREAMKDSMQLLTICTTRTKYYRKIHQKIRTLSATHSPQKF